MIDAATAVESDGSDTGLESALGDELANLLGSRLVRGGHALELSLERRSGNQGTGTLGIVDDLGVDIGVGAGNAQTRTLGSARDLTANTTLTTLETRQLRLMLIHAEYSLEVSADT